MKTLLKITGAILLTVVVVKSILALADYLYQTYGKKYICYDLEEE